MEKKWLLAASVVLAVLLSAAAAGLTFTAQVSEEGVTPTRSTAERPHRIRVEERDVLERKSAEQNAIGNEIERLQEQAADAKIDVSFEELKA